MTTGIYKIEAMCPVAKLAGQAIYIGQSKHIEKRWRQHAKRFPTNQYTYEILLECDADYLDFFEKAFIDGYDSHRNGLNRTIGGTDIRIRYPTKERNYKISQARKGKPAHNKNKPLSEEQKERLRQANLGKKASEETKTKLSEARKGRASKPFSEEHKRNISIAKRGTVVSDETRQKLSKIKTGKKRGPYKEGTGANISKALKGRPGKAHSEETKKKISETRKAMWEQRRATTPILCPIEPPSPTGPDNEREAPFQGPLKD